MKKLSLLLIAILFASNVVLSSERMDVQRSINEANNKFIVACNDMAGSFRSDFRFYNYLRGSCVDYQVKRNGAVNSIYYQNMSMAIKNNPDYGYRMMEFSSRLNQEYLEAIKRVIKEYCEYNNYPQSCSSF